MKSSDSYAHAIAAAGYNVRNLARDQVVFDLATDASPRSPLSVAAALTSQEQRVDLAAAARRVYGDWHFVFTAKGRSAELALARALVKPGMTVLTNGVFRTTQHALESQGARVEVMPRQFQTHGTSDLSLDWLGERFLSDRIDVVIVEPSNNSLFGWPTLLDHVVAVKKLCARYGALLLMDATRLLANCSASGDAVLDIARSFLSVADAFTTSCAKECVVPMGGVVAVRDRGLQHQCWLHAVEEGSSLDLQPLRAQLAAGFNAIAAQPSLIAKRREQLEQLAGRLRTAGVQVVEPVGGHAVFTRIPKNDHPHQDHELQAFLYAQSGMRFLFGEHVAYPDELVVRLPLALATYEDKDLDAIANTLGLALNDADRFPRLVPLTTECEAYSFPRYAIR